MTIKLSKLGALYFILCVMLIKPQYFSTIRILDKAYHGMLMVAFLITVVLFLTSKKLPSFPLLLYCMFGCFLFYKTWTNHKENFVMLILDYLPTLSLAFLFESRKDSDLSVVTNSLLLLLEILIYINFLTILVYPDGLYASNNYSTNWFLGYRNIQIRLMLPAIFLSILKSYQQENKLNLRTKILILVVILSEVLMWSSTSLMGLVLFFAILAIGLFFDAKIPYHLVLISVAVLDIGIILLKIQNYFANFIERFLHRDITFTYRTFIWDTCISLIARRRATGYGYLIDREYVQLLKYGSHPHNYWLYILFMTGFAGAIIILCLFYAVGKRIECHKNTRIYNVCVAYVSAFMFMGIAESLTSAVLFYPMLIFMCYDNDAVMQTKYHRKLILRKRK